MKKLKGRIKTLDEVQVIHYHDNYVYKLQKVQLPLVEGQKERKEPVEEIRLAYWDGKKFGEKAPILPENELAQLIVKAIEKGILSDKFVEILKSNLKLSC